MRLEKKLRSLLVRMQKQPTWPRSGLAQETTMSENQREKIIKLLLTAQMLAVDLGDRALVEKINKAIAEARQGHVRQT